MKSGQIDFLTRYDLLGASSRLRFHLYAPALREAGYRVTERPFFSDGYLRNLYAGGGKSRWSALAATMRRLASAPCWADNLVVEYELLPFFAYAWEALLLRRHRYILNFDDNVWEKYRPLPRLADKYDRLIRSATGVIAANQFLLDKIAPHNGNTILIPTVVDLNEYRQAPIKRKKFTLCWIGTPQTYPYLQTFAPTLQAMARDFDFTLLVIAKRQLSAQAIPGVPMEFADWSQAEEARLIASCHVGIMPLPDDDFARGKSAYKLIQFLAANLPVIASPVGENRRVVTPDCGFLASTTEDWRHALATLREPQIYARFCTGAAERKNEYSLQKYAPIYVDFLNRAFGVSGK